MRGVVRIVLGVLALIALCPFTSFAGLVEEPVAAPDLAAVFAAPVEAPAPGQALPDDAPIFLSSVDDAVFDACCRAANASCSALCGFDVREFRCSRVGANGCSSYCACN
ncbi:MAG TPA: hypothetical protein VHC97_14915 [Thermoanaerobaculia bacterium]|jgi:hypothetical protein|nr:hypothetical protein [Thermoanaerobaculia bacterium]